MTAGASMLAMTRNKVLGLEDHVRGAIALRRLQRIAHVPALGQRQPLVGHLSVRRVRLGGQRLQREHLLALPWPRRDPVHTLPYPDNTFDVVTLQFTSRHLRIRHVAEEIRRVLKPGGRFYHSDMLRPGNPVVEKLYCGYLRLCLWFTSFLFRSGPAALNCKEYFIQALQMFYSAQELSDMLEDVGFRDVTAYKVFSGMLGFHRAVKPPA
jgi:SAM-dependent methyltransferase